MPRHKVVGKIIEKILAASSVAVIAEIGWKCRFGNEDLVKNPFETVGA